MKRRLFSLISVALIASIISGCGLNTAKVNINNKFKQVAQMVIATNPVILYDDSTVVAPVNDIIRAINKDKSSSTITAFSETDWSWITEDEKNWKKRPIYGVEKWVSGTGAENSKLDAYSFSSDGSISIANYSTSKISLSAYGDDTIPSVGLLLSVGGKTKEAFCYTVPKDGKVSIPSGTFTAIEKVGKIKTGFLAEDKTGRSAVVTINVNSKPLYCGQFCNSVAGDGTATTQLTYPELNNINVTAGDTITINLILSAKVNSSEDVTMPDDSSEADEDGNAYVYNDGNSNKDNDKSDNSSSDIYAAIPKNVSLLDGFDARFKILRSGELNGSSLQKVVLARIAMENTLGTEVFMYDDITHEETSDYEIIIGECNRKESQQVYKELTEYRANHAADYIIRMVGKKLIIAATTEYALGNAIDYFMSNYCKSDASTVPSSLNYVYRPKMKNIMLGDNNIAAFSIRTERYPSVITVNAAKDIQNWILENTGYTVSRTDDRTVSDYEILVYSTARSGYDNYDFRTSASETLADDLDIEYDDYKITFNGKKLFINAGSVSAANLAVQEMLKEFDKNAATGTVKINDKYVKTGTYNQKEYSLSGNYALTWSDQFTGDYDSNTRINKNKWHIELNNKPLRGPYYKLSDVFSRYGISSLEELKKKANGNWIIGDYSFLVSGTSLSGTVPDGYVMNGAIRSVCYENKNGGTAYIDNNALHFVRRQIVDASDPLYDGYSSDTRVALQTAKSMNFKYGIFELRLIAPFVLGNACGVWLNYAQGNSSVSAGQLMPEIDFCESFGNDNKSVHNLHTWVYGKPEAHVSHGDSGAMGIRPWATLPEGERFDDTYHHMAIEWTPDYITFLLDGEPFQTIEINNAEYAAFHENVYAQIENQAANDTYMSNLPLTVCNSFEEYNNYRTDMYVDYINLYQKNEDDYTLLSR